MRGRCKGIPTGTRDSASACLPPHKPIAGGGSKQPLPGANPRTSALGTPFGTRLSKPLATRASTTSPLRVAEKVGLASLAQAAMALGMPADSQLTPAMVLGTRETRMITAATSEGRLSWRTAASGRRIRPDQ